MKKPELRESFDFFRTRSKYEMHGVQNHFTFLSNIPKNIGIFYQENIRFIQWRKFPQTGLQNTFESQPQFPVTQRNQNSIYDVRQADGVLSVMTQVMWSMKCFIYQHQVRFLTSMQLPEYDKFRDKPIQTWL